MKNIKILFIGKDNDIFSKIFFSILKKNFKSVLSIYDNSKNHRKIRAQIKKFKTGYILSFRSSYLFTNKEINRFKKKILNFHPGPPEYRGVGCINFALLKNEKFYGATVHLVDSVKIDSGKIIDIKKWKINNFDSIDEILTKTYHKQLSQLKKIIKYLKAEKLENLINKNKNKYWCKKLYTRKKLELLYKIKVINKQNLPKLLRATVTKKFKPYVLINGKKFVYEN